MSKEQRDPSGEPGIFWMLDESDGADQGARRELAASIRALAERMLVTEAGAAELSAARDHVRAALDLLPEGPGCRERFDNGIYSAAPREHIDRTALMGRSNPMAPPMHATWDGERSRTAIAFTEVHQGAPGMAHGGWVASVLDQVAGHVLVMAGRRGFTGKLTIRYLRPTPLHAELDCLGWIEAEGTRTVTVKLAVERDGVRLVEGEALMVQMDAERAQQIIRGAS